MSGYKLDSSNACILTNNFDFNVAAYQAKKYNLILNKIIIQKKL